MMVIATGLQGAGKTFLTRKYLDAYLKKHSNRTILVFDPNDEDAYHNIPAIYWNIADIQRARTEEKKSNYTKRIITKSEKLVSKLPKGKIFRIVPYTLEKRPQRMSQKQLKETMISLCKYFSNGLLLLDDVNVYCTNFEREEIVGALKNLRHKGCDLIMHLQSLNPMRRIHMETCRVIRMHRDNMTMSVIKTKLGDNYDLFYIARNLVQIMAQKNKYVHLNIYVQERKIKGAFTKEEYAQACRKFIMREPSILRPYLLETKKDQKKALELWMNENDFYGNHLKKILSA